MTTKEKMKRLYEYVAKLSVHYSSKKQVGLIDFKLNTREVQEAIASMAAYNSKLITSGKATARAAHYNYTVGGEIYVNSFFLTGSGHCGTVASAYKTLLNHIGIECEIIDGTSTGGLHHMWNVVKYNGKWYFCDCDAEHENYSRLVKKDGELSYAFFLKGTKTFKNNYNFGFSSTVVHNGSTVKIEAKDVK